MAVSPSSIVLPASGAASRALTVEFNEAPQCPEWDEFLERTPDGHHEQTAGWGEVRTLLGWQVCRVLVREQGRVVGGAQLQTRPLKKFGRWGYITYGPCLAGDDPQLQDAVLTAIKKCARAKGLLFLVVGLPYEAHGLTQRLLAQGFFYKPPHVPPTFIQATAMIDLTAGTEKNMAAMRRRTQRNVKHALKKGIRLVEQSEEGLATFYQLMVTLCERRGTKPNPANLDFFVQLWRRFHPKGWVRLFFAMNGEVPVSAALAFTFRDSFRVWKVGWSGEFSNLTPNDGMWWELIEWARALGFRQFDFVEIDAGVAKELVAGRDRESLPDDVTSYKLGFGGEVKLLPGADYYVTNPVARVLFRCGLARVLASPTVLKFAKKAG